MFWQSDSTTEYKDDWGSLRLSGSFYRLPAIHRYAHTDPDAYGDVHAHIYANGDPHGDAHANRDLDADSHTEPQPNGHLHVDARRRRSVQFEAPSGMTGTAMDRSMPASLGCQASPFSYGEMTFRSAQRSRMAMETYRFASLAAGSYRVREAHPSWMRYSSTPDEVTVQIRAGEEGVANFGDWNGRFIYLPLLARE